MAGLFPGAGGEQLARESGVPFLGRVPFDPALAAAADRGEPYVTSAPERPRRARSWRSPPPCAQTLAAARAVTARFCLLCGGAAAAVRDDGHRAVAARAAAGPSTATRRRRAPPWCWRPAVAAGASRRPPYAGHVGSAGWIPRGGGEPLGALRRELREEIGVGVRRARLIGFATDQLRAARRRPCSRPCTGSRRRHARARGRRRLRGSMVPAARDSVSPDRVPGDPPADASLSRDVALSGRAASVPGGSGRGPSGPRSHHLRYGQETPGASW